MLQKQAGDSICYCSSFITLVQMIELRHQSARKEIWNKPTQHYTGWAKPECSSVINLQILQKYLNMPGVHRLTESPACYSQPCVLSASALVAAAHIG